MKLPADHESRSLYDLQDEFRGEVVEVLRECREQAIEMRPFFTVRGPAVQARLWAQSRTPEQIERARAMLIRAKAPWLAGFLKTEYAMRGRWATAALPGQSWHQWGEAIDCFAVGTRGEAVWANAVYECYATAAKVNGLEAGHWWASKDSVHVQLRNEGRPHMIWAEIEDAMRERFE